MDGLKLELRRGGLLLVSAALFSLISLSLLGVSVSPAAAQEEASGANGRLGRVMSLRSESPAVWIRPDRAWTPAGVSRPLTACVADGRCAPIVETSRCEVPECPGAGELHHIDRGLAEVADFPQGYEGFHREQEAMRRDASFAPLVGHFQAHPEESERARERSENSRSEQRERQRHAEGVRWISRYRDGDRWEVSAHVGFGGSLVDEESLYGQLLITLGPHLLLSRDLADEDRDFNPFTLLGDELGLEARARFVGRLGDGAGLDWGVALGAAPTIRNRLADTEVRYFSLISPWIPEIGVFLRPDRDPSLYLAWEMPVEILWDHDHALSIRLNLMWIENAYEVPDQPSIPSTLEGVDDDGDDEPSAEEVILGVSIGVIWP